MSSSLFILSISPSLIYLSGFSFSLCILLCYRLIFPSNVYNYSSSFLACCLLHTSSKKLIFCKKRRYWGFEFHHKKLYKLMLNTNFSPSGPFSSTVECTWKTHWVVSVASLISSKSIRGSMAVEHTKVALCLQENKIGDVHVLFI